MQITDEEIELMRAKISRDLGFYDNAGKVRFEMFMLIKKWLLANRLEAIVRQGVSQPVQTAGKFALITKRRTPDIIILADTKEELDGSIENLYWNKRGVQPQGSDWTKEDMMRDYRYEIVKIYIENLPGGLSA